MLGPPLDGAYGTSVRLVERVLRARDPMLPRFGFSVVDVRDVAEMHLRALAREEAVGERFIGAGRFVWYAEMARMLKAGFPDRKVVTRQAPDLLVRALALFDASVRPALPLLGRQELLTSDKARAVLGVAFRPVEDTVRDTGRALIGMGVV